MRRDGRDICSDSDCSDYLITNTSDTGSDIPRLCSVPIGL